ncbi:MAG TPA: acylphosphatase [Rhodothermales bacterium]|nr:acylphosphatase [Rhodothermales bacterium]
MQGGAAHARLSVRVSGRVQGVGFRQHTQAHARALGLTGWVRNDHDGSVSVVAEGPRPNLERLLHDLRAGPRTARVDDVSVQWSRPTYEFDSFTVTY